MHVVTSIEAKVFYPSLEIRVLDELANMFFLVARGSSTDLLQGGADGSPLETQESRANSTFTQPICRPGRLASISTTKTGPWRWRRNMGLIVNVF
jgi:hypothetical protein